MLCLAPRVHCISVSSSDERCGACTGATDNLLSSVQAVLAHLLNCPRSAGLAVRCCWWYASSHTVCSCVLHQLERTEVSAGIGNAVGLLRSIQLGALQYRASVAPFVEGDAAEQSSSLGTILRQIEQCTTAGMSLL